MFSVTAAATTTSTNTELELYQAHLIRVGLGDLYWK